MPTLTKEVWRNVSTGLRYFIALDPLGNQTHKTVQAGKTFSISAVERRMNQEAAYATKADMFRNGTFIMESESEDTDQDEIRSDNAVSSHQIETAVAAAVDGDSVAVEAMIARLTSLVTAERVFEELVSADARQSLVDMAKHKVEELTERPIGPDGQPMKIAEREVIPASVPSSDEAFKESRGQRPR